MSDLSLVSCVPPRYRVFREVFYRQFFLFSSWEQTERESKQKGTGHGTEGGTGRQAE